MSGDSIKNVYPTIKHDSESESSDEQEDDIRQVKIGNQLESLNLNESNELKYSNAYNELMKDYLFIRYFVITDTEKSQSLKGKCMSN